MILELRFSNEQEVDDVVIDDLAAVTHINCVGLPHDEFLLSEAACEVLTPDQQDILVGENLSVLEDNFDIISATDVIQKFIFAPH